MPVDYKAPAVNLFTFIMGNFDNPNFIQEGFRLFKILNLSSDELFIATKDYFPGRIWNFDIFDIGRVRKEKRKTLQGDLINCWFLYDEALGRSRWYIPETSVLQHCGRWDGSEACLPIQEDDIWISLSPYSEKFAAIYRVHQDVDSGQPLNKTFINFGEKAAADEYLKNHRWTSAWIFDEGGQGKFLCSKILQESRLKKSRNSKDPYSYSLSLSWNDLLSFWEYLEQFDQYILCFD
jgi:hypothetical protein